MLPAVFDNPFFGTVIAIVTLYLVFSQLTLSLIELPAGFLNSRGRYLYNHLQKALGPIANAAFYGAAPIKSLEMASKLKWRDTISTKPAYVSETLFAQTIVAWVMGKAPAGAAPLSAIQQFKTGLDTLSGTVGQGGAVQADVDFTALLQTLYTNATATAAPADQSQALQKNLEAWFHEFGERMTGWYKRDQRWPLFWVGLAVAVLADVDTVRLARFLADSGNAKARMALVEAGAQAAREPAPTGPVYNPNDPVEARRYQLRQDRWDSLAATANRDFRASLAAVPAVGLPLGPVRWANHDTVSGYEPAAPPAKPGLKKVYKWAPAADDFGLPPYAQRWQLDKKTGNVSFPLGALLRMIGGWLLTAFAMMLGAPFWFDTLCRFVNIRNVGIKPAKADK